MRAIYRLSGDDALQGVKVPTRVEVVPCRELVLGKRPDLDFVHLERIEDRHRDRVGALVRQMSANPGPEPLIGLADIDRLEIVVEEGVDAPAVMSDPSRRTRWVRKRRVEEAGQASAKVFGFERRDVDVIGVRAAAEIKHGVSPSASTS